MNEHMNQQGMDPELQRLFDAARQERSPLSADDVRQVLSTHASPTSSPIPPSPHRPIFLRRFPMLALAAAATAALVFISSENGERRTENVVVPGKQSEQVAQGRPTVDESVDGGQWTVDAAPKAPLTPAAPSAADREDATTPAQRVQRSVSVRVQAQSMPFETVMAALHGDEELLRSLRISDDKLDVMLCASTGDRACIREASTVPCPAPVMATSLDGRGRVFSFANCKAGEVDPNKLVAVAAKHEGQDVLMWYPPTADFLAAMPDSMKNELAQIIEIDVRDDGTKKHIRIRTSRDGELVTEDFRPLIDSTSFRFDSLFNGIGIVQKDLERLGGNIDKDLQQSMRIMQQRMKELQINMDSMGTALKKMRIRVRTSDDSGSVNSEEIEIEMPRIELNMDAPDAPDAEARVQAPARVQRNVRVMRLDAPSKPLDAPSKPLDAPNAPIDAPSAPLHAPTSPLFEGSLLQDLCAQSKVILIAHCKPDPKSKVKAKRQDETAGLQETGRTSNGAVSVTSVYPNPTSDGGATLGFTLTEPRTLHVALHDLTGNKVMDLSSGVKRAAGTGQLAFTLPGVPPGMYLVMLTTEKGETALQRLIVRE